jgi:hypothetical protein
VADGAQQLAESCAFSEQIRKTGRGPDSTGRSRDQEERWFTRKKPEKIRFARSEGHSRRALPEALLDLLNLPWHHFLIF